MVSSKGRTPVIKSNLEITLGHTLAATHLSFIPRPHQRCAQNVYLRPPPPAPCWLATNPSRRSPRCDLPESENNEGLGYRCNLEVVLLFDKDFVVMHDAMIRAKDAQRFAEIAAEQVYDRRDPYHRHSEDYESAEADLKEMLGCIRDLVRDTAAAAHAPSFGTNDRDNNGEGTCRKSWNWWRICCIGVPTTTTLSSYQWKALLLHQAEGSTAE